MDEQQIQDIADRVVAALNNLAPGEAPWWAWLTALTPVVGLIAAFIAGWVGWHSLKQKREADSRSEWWRRTQWALEAAVSDKRAMKDYGLAMLELQARSKLAGPEEDELLEVTLGHTSTKMNEGDEGIQTLLDDAENIAPGVATPSPPPPSNPGQVDDQSAEGENEGSKGGQP